MTNVTSLATRGSVPCADEHDLSQWLLGWAKDFADGDYGKFRSVVVVLEDMDGQVACITQAVKPMDRTRLVGLLTTLAHRKMDGGADIDDWNEDNP